MTLKVTVLIVNYNGEASVGRAIESALSQRFPRDAYEILAVDDGSTDRSVQILESYQLRIRTLRLVHGGLPAACNEGIRNARGTYLVRLDADDELEPDLLAETVAVLDREPGVALVTTDRWVVHDATGKIERVWVDADNLYDYIAPGVMFRTPALLEVGLYNQLYWEEYDLFVRLLTRYAARHIAQPLYRYHRHPGSMTANIEDRWRGWEALIHTWGADGLRRFGRNAELEAVAASLHPEGPVEGRVLSAAHDAGGCNAILPVLKSLTAAGVPITILADGPAYRILTANGLAAHRVTLEEARAGLSRHVEAWQPDAVLVSTSHGPSLEDCVIAEARRRNIPSVGILDAWLLYDERFVKGTDRWAYLPDTLVVMDELAKQEMVQLGAPGERLLPLGQPQFDQLQARAASMTDEGKKRVRASLGLSPGERYLLFLSQDMERFYGGRAHALATLGYTEVIVLEHLCESLRRVSQRRGGVIRLVVKLHPREDPDKYAAFNLPVIQEADPYELMMSADLVVGMDTVLLVEAGWLGCPTLSFQPGRKSPDSLVTNRLGIGRFCYDPSSLDGMLDTLLYHADQRDAAVRTMRGFQISPGATGRVTNLVLSLLRVKEQVQ